MNIHYTTELVNKPSNECPACDRKRYTSFDWDYARSGKNFDLSIIAAQLKLSKSLKFGELFQCKTCKAYWHLSFDNMMYRVPQDRIDLLELWSSSHSNLTAEQIKTIESIGGTEADQYGNDKGLIKFPCSIETVDGRFFDMAMVLITKHSPIAEWQKNVLLGNQVRAISPSTYSLPLAVRLATLAAHECSMGFAPTVIQAQNGQHFILNWANNFFLHGSISGKDILSATYNSDSRDRLPPVNEPRDQILYVYFDWFDGCERLIRRIE